MNATLYARCKRSPDRASPCSRVKKDCRHIKRLSGPAAPVRNMTELGNKTKETGQAAVNRTKEAAQTVGNKTKEAGQAVADRAQEAGEKIKSKAKEATGR